MDIRRSYRALLFGLFVGAAGLAILACEGEEAKTGDVDVANPRLVQTSNGERSFTGTLVNRRSSTISIAQIEVALYDDRGSEVETVRIEVKDVPPQDSVDFSGTIDSDRAFRQAQVKRILTP
jgi:hypothetical protein